MVPSRLAVAVWMPLWLLGCPKPDDATDRDRLVPLLESADELWEERGRWGFDAAAGKLEQALALAPADPGVRWRLARLETGRGLAAEDRVASARHYSRAREHAVRCLLDEPAFERAWAGLGWEDAIAKVPLARAPCLDWATFAWARWFATLGGSAAAVDLSSLDVLVARLATSPDPFELGPWSEGLVAAHRPDVDGRDLDIARGAFEAAIDQQPSDLSRRADLVLWVAVPAGDSALVQRQISAIEERHARTPEDQRAKLRVASVGTGAVEQEPF